MEKHTRQDIFMAAIDMFSTMGYTESTMRELAKRVGIQSASLYYHYASKDALLDEIFDHFIRNDDQYRTATMKIIETAPDMSVEEILASTVIEYTNDERFILMNKILRIAIGYQFESTKAREVFDYIYYEMALNARDVLFKELIDREILMPFDYKTISYIITSYSLALFMQCTNNGLPIEEFAGVYNDGMHTMIHMISPLITKCAKEIDG